MNRHMMRAVDWLLLPLLRAPAIGPDTGLSSGDILQKVDAFYTSSWSHLLTYTAVSLGFVGVLVTIIGVVLPIVLQRAQIQVFKLEADTISNRVEVKLRGVVDALAAQLRADALAQDAHLKQELEKLDGRLEELRASLQVAGEKAQAATKTELLIHIGRAESRALHVQGLMLVQSQEFILAAQSLAMAVPAQVASRDESNLGRVLIALELHCLPRLIKAAFQQVPSLDQNLQRMLAAVATLDGQGAYTDRLVRMQQLIEQAKSRAA